jgi:hypothetical protein
MPVTYDAYADVRKVDLSVVFTLMDEDASATATPSSNDVCPYMSQIQQTLDGNEIMGQKFTTLERDFWILDGTFPLMEAEDVKKYQSGYWSDSISDANGDFAVPPTLVFSWEHNRSSIGFTIFFDDKSGEYPSRFMVRSFDYAGQITAEGVFENDGISRLVEFQAPDYRHLAIYFLKTKNPYRRVRVTEVVFGLVKYFDDNNISNATLIQEVSLASENLPVTEFTFTTDNSDRLWNIANPKGIFNFLQNYHPLDVTFSINGENVYMGAFYFNNVTAEDNALTAKINCADKIYWLDNAVFTGTTTANRTLADTISLILQQSGVDLEAEIPSALGARLINGNFGDGKTCRECIRMAAQAAMTACFINRAGKLQFFDPLQLTKVSETLDFGRMYEMPKITASDKVNVLQLAVRQPNGSETIYTASDVKVDEAIRIVRVENPLVIAANGQAVAEWLLDLKMRRFNYVISERGNPALDLRDILTVYDPYGGINDVMITKQSFAFDGGLKNEVNANGTFIL